MRLLMRCECEAKRHLIKASTSNARRDSQGLLTAVVFLMLVPGLGCRYGDISVSALYTTADEPTADLHYASVRDQDGATDSIGESIRIPADRGFLVWFYGVPYNDASDLKLYDTGTLAAIGSDGMGPFAEMQFGAVSFPRNTIPLEQRYLFRGTLENSDGVVRRRTNQLEVIHGPAPCGRRGERCCADGSCDPDNDCRAGICSIPCREGESCTASDQEGECRHGTQSCGASSTICVPGRRSDEVCDNKDNDCDGEPDDIRSAPCSADAGSCLDGFTVRGTTSCEGGQEVCVATERWCPDAGSRDCGNPAYTPCTTQSSCMPGTVCVDYEYSSSKVCMRNDECDRPIPPLGEACWMPSEKGAPCFPYP